MPKVGVEPTLLYRNYALNVARLPIPPLRHVRAIVHGFKALSTVHGSELRPFLKSGYVIASAVFGAKPSPSPRGRWLRGGRNQASARSCASPPAPRKDSFHDFKKALDQNFYAVKNISYLDTSFSKGKITPCSTHPTIYSSNTINHPKKGL